MWLLVNDWLLHNITHINNTEEPLHSIGYRLSSDRPPALVGYP